MIGDIDTYLTFKTVYPNEGRKTSFFGWEASSKLMSKLRVQQEINMKQQVKTHCGSQSFNNYALHALRPHIFESGESEIKNIGEKFQHKNESVLHKDLRNAK